jgi:3-oxoacyl-[acyl-carrier-protein] synthase III
MGIVLSRPGIYVPEQRLTNKDLVELVDEQGRRVLDTSDEWIVQRSGIHERRVSLDMDVKEMGVRAIRNLQEILEKPLNPDEIRFATNRHRDGEFPCYAATIAAELGLNKVIIHDGLAGCTGLVFGIRDAFNAMLAGETNSALVGGVERLTDFTNYADRNTCFLFGDGAGFYKLERRDGVEGIIANALGGMPDIGDKEWPYGFLANPKMQGKKLRLTSKGFIAVDAEDQYLVMKGNEIFKFATRVMRSAIHDVLDRSNYKLSDVEVIIPHGANLRIIEAAAKKLKQKGFKGEIYTNMDRFANPSTASIPIAAAEAIERGIIKEESLVINVAFGAGFTYGANLYRATIN